MSDDVIAEYIKLELLYGRIRRERLAATANMRPPAKETIDDSVADQAVG